jgi:hypothetical protein
MALSKIREFVLLLIPGSGALILLITLLVALTEALSDEALTLFEGVPAQDSRLNTVTAAMKHRDIFFVSIMNEILLDKCAL